MLQRGLLRLLLRRRLLRELLPLQMLLLLLLLEELKLLLLGLIQAPSQDPGQHRREVNISSSAPRAPS